MGDRDYIKVETYLAVRADESVDFDNVDLIKLLQGLLYLSLVGLDIDNEHKGVVLLELLHRRLGVEGVDDDLYSLLVAIAETIVSRLESHLVLIQAGLMGNGLAEV